MSPNKPGRKPLPPAERRIGRNIYRTPDEWAQVEAIGQGNRQEGERLLLAAWKERKKGGKG